MKKDNKNEKQLIFYRFATQTSDCLAEDVCRHNSIFIADDDCAPNSGKENPWGLDRAVIYTEQAEARFATKTDQRSPKKEIVGVRRVATVIEQPEEVVVLPVDVTCDREKDDEKKSITHTPGASKQSTTQTWI